MVEDDLELPILLCECWVRSTLPGLPLTFSMRLLDGFKRPVTAHFVSMLGSSRCQWVKSVNHEGLQTDWDGRGMGSDWWWDTGE